MHIAVVAIVKDEGLYLKEWIAYHALRGLTNFVVYNNDSSDDTLHILRSATGITVTIHDWPYIEGVAPQMSAYNDAIARHGADFDFMFFFDIDEFLLPTGVDTIPQILAKLPVDVGAVGINQRVFGSSGLLNYEPGLVIERFQHCAPEDYNEHVWIKSCYRPSCVGYIGSPHLALLTSGRYAHPDGSELIFSELVFGTNNRAPVAPVDFGQIQLNHYMLKSRAEFLTKRARGVATGYDEKTRKERYEDMNYFDYRDTRVNKVVDPRAAQMAVLVKKKIYELWHDAA